MTGEATVISAMGSGRRSAKAIHEYLLTKGNDRTNSLLCQSGNQAKEEAKLPAKPKTY
jgi:hypothetical protein